MAGFLVEDVDVEAGDGFGDGAGFGGEGLGETAEVGEDGAAAFCLPVGVVDETPGERVHKPIKSRNVAPLARTCNGLQTRQIPLINHLTMWIFLPNRPHCCWCRI